jgi:indole-3-glycerol phosphate synthase
MSGRGSTLEAIVERTRERVRSGGYAPRKPAAAPEGERFAASLRLPGTRIIAEIKKRSPSAGEIVPNAEGKIESFALAYRRGHAAAISVVTETDFFGGSADWLSRVRRISGLPVLMKDFILEESQLDFAASCGADAVLLILRILTDEEFGRLNGAAVARNLAVLAEAHDEREIRRAAEGGAQVIGLNARDLGTFKVDLEALGRLAEKVPADKIRVAESGIKARSDIESLSGFGFQAFLVGEALLRAGDPERLLRELRGDE